MSDKTTQARPYANAIFAIAQAGPHLALWDQYLQVLALLLNDRRLLLVLTDPRVGPDDLLAFLRDLIKNCMPESQQLLPHADNLLQLLLANKRLQLAPEIYTLFQQARARFERRQPVHLTSAFPVSAAQIQQISEAMRIRLGCDVTLTQTQDEKLIGGAVIRAGDLVIDGSIRGKLQQLAHDLVT